ncbi:hypothetical protein D8B45_01345 [Candidatus Gracilibacteria bacterium]|nr:MAG: hypothetical protein D8B45_01345 [Candidatus Gracilibacteria bacterium]
MQEVYLSLEKKQEKSDFYLLKMRTTFRILKKCEFLFGKCGDFLEFSGEVLYASYQNDYKY